MARVDRQGRTEDTLAARHKPSSAAHSAVTEITVLQPEASVLVQPVELGQVSRSCSRCWWRRFREELGPQKDGRIPEASSSGQKAFSKAVTERSCIL